MTQIDELKTVIGRRIKTARKETGMTQEQLSAEINRSVEAVSNIERGASLPPLDTLLAIGDVVKLSLTDLIDMPDGKLSGRRAEIEAEILVKLRRFDDARAETALKLIHALAEQK